MRHTEEEIFYEVEVMLGRLDESHIIRTIEYWDIERQRRPQWDHRAVIVAEEITTRFFNVLRLLNRAVPLIAIKLSAFRVNDKIILHPVTVLNVIEEAADPDALDPVERADRNYWEKKSPSTLGIMDKIISSLRTSNIDPRIAYNRGHIALGTTGYNFCWFHPRKTGGYVEIRVNDETRDAEMSALQELGINASPRRTDVVTFNITLVGLQQNIEAIIGLIKRAEHLSRQA